MGHGSVSVRWGRRAGVVALALALVAGACGDDDAGQEAGTTTVAPSTTAPPADAATTTTVADSGPELTASYRGVTEDTIRLGVVLFDLDAILELGVDVGYGDQTQHYQLVIDEINAAGGVNGRRIEPVYELVSPVDPAQSDAVCLEFIEDREVFAVVGTLRPPENVLCYTEAGDTPFIGAPSGDLSDDVFDRSTVPFVYPGRRPSRTDAAIVDAMALDAAIDGAVVAVHGAEASRIDALVEALREQGAADVVATVETADEADQFALARELDVFVQRYITEGVQGVVNLGDNVAFLAALNRAGFRVPVWTTSPDVTADFIYDQGATVDELREVRLVGGESAADLYEDGHVPTVECVDRWNEARPDEPAKPDPQEDDLNNFGVIVVACANLDIFVRAATAAGPELTVPAFVAGLDTVGSFENAGRRSASLAADKWDASDAARIYRWSDDEAGFIGVEDLELG